MEKALYLEGKKYISASRGAALVGYNSDYVGQLSRSGKLDAKLVGRSWYVSEESILKHKADNTTSHTFKSSKKKSHSTAKAKSIYLNTLSEELNDKKLELQIPTPTPTSLSVPTARIKYIKDKSLLFPELNKKNALERIEIRPKNIESKFSNFERNIFAGALALLLIVSSIGIFSFRSEIKDSSRKALSYFDSLRYESGALALSSVGDSWSNLSNWSGKVVAKILEPWFRKEGGTQIVVNQQTHPTATSLPNRALSSFSFGESTNYIDARIDAKFLALRNEFLSSPTLPNINRFYIDRQLDSLVKNLSSGGSSSNTTIVTSGASALSDLTDISLGALSYGDLLLYNGSSWTNISTSSLGIVSGGSSDFPFAIQTWGVSTSTTIGLLNGFLSTASSTIVGNATTTGSQGVGALFINGDYITDFTGTGLSVTNGVLNSSGTAASSTLLADTNSWSGVNHFALASTTYASFTTASTTNLNIGGQTFVGLLGSGLSNSSNILTVSGLTTSNFASANISQFTNDTGYKTFAWPFTPISTGYVATSTTIGLLNGFLSTASSTIVGNATTTGSVGAGAIFVNNDYITDFTGTGLSVTNGVLNTSGTAASSTLLADTNSWSGVNRFNYASSTYASFTTASTTNLNIGGQSFIGLLGSGLSNTNNVLTLDRTGDWTGTLDGFNGFGFPFTAQSYGVSTTTTLGLLNGFFSTASSTISGTFNLSSLGQGGLYTGSNGLVGTFATTTATCTGDASCTPFTIIGSSPITISATAGASSVSGGGFTGMATYWTSANTVGATSTLSLNNFVATSSTAINTFPRLANTYASSTYSSFDTASTTNLNIGGQSFVGLLGSGLSNSSNILTVSGLTTSNFASANVSQFTNDAGYKTFAWPFTPISAGYVATSTTIGLLNGFLSTASSTIVGNATTTGGQYVGALNLNGDYISDITGSGLSITNGVLNASGASSTLLADTNSWSGVNRFNNASSTYHSFTTASTTNLNIGGQTFVGLLGSGLLNTNNVLTLDRTGDWTGTLDGFNGFGFPFTAQSYGVSTTTTLGLLNGFFSTASSTISSSLYLPSLTQGFAYTGSSGQVNTIASSSVRLSWFNNDSGFITSSGVFAFPFTPTSYGVSTSTTIGLLNGFFSTASSTISGPLQLSALSPGQVNVGANGLVYSGATTTFSSGLTYSNGNVTNTGVTSIVAGTNMTVSGATGAVTINGLAWPFTPISAGVVATTSQINLAGFLSTASSTIVGNATTTGSVGAGAIFVNNDYITDFTGTGLSVTNGVLNTSGTAASSTLLADTNFWSNLQRFNYSSTTYSSFTTASTTNLNIGGSSFTSLLGSGLSNAAGSLTVAGLTTSNLASANVSQFTNDAGYKTFAWPFTPISAGVVATTSQINLAGFLSTASSTIVGNATTTGGQYVGAVYGAGLTACNSITQKLIWQADGTFTCGSDAGSGGAVDGTGFAGMATYWVDADTVAATSTLSVNNFVATSSTAINTFPRLANTYASSTYSSFDTASTTNLSIGGSSFRSLLGSGLSNAGGSLTVSGLTTSNFTSPNISQFNNDSNYASFPFTVNTGYNSTSTVIGFNGLFSTASSTFSSDLRLSSLSQGFAYVGSTGKVNSIASSSINLSWFNNDSGFLTSTFAFPFTPTSYGVSTSTTLGLLNGFFSTASSTISGPLQLSALTAGQVNVGANGLVYSGATTTFSSGLTYSNGNVTNTGVTSIVAGTNMTVSGATGAVTINGLAWPFTPISAGVVATTSQINLAGFLSTASSTIVGNATTTGSVGAGAIFVNNDYITDFTGTGLSVTNGVLNSSGTAASSTLLADFNTFSNTNNFTGKVGLSSSTPWGKLSVNPNGLGSGVPEFVIGSSTATHFIVDGAGRVGIGTANPTVPLEVIGDARFVLGNDDGFSVTKADGTPLFSTRNSPNGIDVPIAISFSGIADGRLTSEDATLTGGYTFGISGQGAPLTLFTSGDHDVTFGTNSTSRMTLSHDGKLGIGTTTPQWLTQLAGTAPSLAITDTAAGTNQKHWLLTSKLGDLLIGTSTDLYATSSQSALTISGTGFGTTTVIGLNIIGKATSTSNVGFNVTSGCYAVNGTCLSSGSGSSASSTLLADTNSWSGVNRFNYASSTYASFTTASTTNLNIGGQSFVGLLGSGLSNSANILTVSGLTTSNFASANVSQFTNDAGYKTFAWPFTPNSYGVATSTTIGLLNGFLSTASSTIVGNATTTGSQYVGAINVGGDYISDITGSGLLVSGGALTVSNVPVTSFSTLPINSIVTTNSSGQIIATGTQLTVGNILATTTATSTLPRLLTTNATTTSLAISGITSSLLKTDSFGSVIGATAGVDYLAASSFFAFPFTMSTAGASTYAGTSTTLLLTNGFLSTASSTIVGNATTTGTQYIGSQLSVAGNVGIGVTSPTYQLETSGGVLFRGNGITFGTAGAPVSALSQNAAGYTQVGGGNQNGVDIYDHVTQVARFDTANSYLINTNVGIGTTSPFAKLSVHANNGDTNSQLFTVGSSTAIATSTLFTVLNNGNVGIGTANPAYSLESTGAIKSGQVLLSSNGNGALIESLGGAGNLVIRPTSPGYYLTLAQGGGINIGSTELYNGATNGSALNVQGFVGIGTTTPTYNLTVASSTALTDGAGVAQWVTRNAGGNLYFSTTTLAGTATTSISALEISGTGFGTTTLRGLNIAGQATSTSNVGINITTGCYAISGSCISGGSSSNNASSTLLADTNYWSGVNRFNYASSTYDSFTTASTTNLNIGGSSFNSLLGTGLTNTGGALTLNATGDWTGTLDGFNGFGFPFTMSTAGASTYAGTSTTLLLTNGFLSTASSTIVGNATTTGTQYVGVLNVNGDYISDITGSGLSVSGGALTVSNVPLTSLATLQPNSVVTTNSAGNLIATGTQLTVGNILATSTATSTLPTVLSTKSTTTALAITGITSSLLKTDSNGNVLPASAGSDYLAASSFFAFPFTMSTAGASTYAGTSTTLLLTNGFLSTASSTVVGNATTTGSHSAGAIILNSDYITDFTGTGLSLSGGALTLNATGDWTGTIDGNNFAGGAIGAGELLYGASAGSLTELAVSTNGFVLALSNGVPTWVATSTLANISGTLPVSKGGTNATTFAPNSIITSDAAGTTLIATTSQLTVGSLISTSTATSFFKGDLGVGTSTPYSNLTVWGNGKPNILEVANSASTTFLKVSNTGFGTTTVSGLTIAGSATSTSNVGFNITSGCYAVNGTCVGNVTSSGSGDITAVGSMASGDAFADATADDDWLGLGGSAGRIEFDDQATDEVNILNANVGIGLSAPTALLSLQGAGTALDLFRIASTTNALSVLTITQWGGFLQNVSSTTAIDVQNGKGSSVFAVDTTQTASAGIDITAGGGQTTNLLSLYSSGSTLLSGFTASGALYMDIASTTAIDILNGSGAPSFIVDSSNKAVGIGTSTLTYNLNVEGAQATSYIQRIYNTNSANTADGLLISLAVAPASRGTGNYFIGFSDGSQTVAGKIQGGASAVAYTTSGADLAEYFLVSDLNDMPTPGEIVALDLGSNRKIKKALGKDDITVGITSTNPGFIGNGPICPIDETDCDENYEKYNVLVALAGQVPVKVTDENGVVHTGDYLTMSKTVPGAAMKAIESGQVVGVALTNASSTLITSHTSVIAFVRNEWRTIVSGNLAGAATSSAAFLVNQTGGGDLLQVQQNGIDRLIVRNDGAVIISSNVSTPTDLFTIQNESSDVFSINSKGDLKVKGIILSGKDTAGSAIISKGDNSVHVSFENPYPGAPKISATAQGLPDGPYGVIEKTGDGFTIVMNGVAQNDLSFDWVAVYQPEATNYQSLITNLAAIGTIQIVTPPAPAGTGTTTPPVDPTSTSTPPVVDPTASSTPPVVPPVSPPDDTASTTLSVLP